MGIQHEGAHARVFRGLDGERRVHMLRKRTEDYNDNLHRFIHMPAHNTNHNNVKMNIPEGYSSSVSSSSTSSAAPAPTRVLDKDYHNNVKWNVPEGYSLSLANKQQADAEDVETVYSVVYKTMSASFTGNPAGYTTESVQASPTNVAQSGAQTAAAPAATSTQNSDESAYESAKAAAHGGAASSSSTAGSYPTRQVIPQQASSSAAVASSAAATAAVAGEAQNAGVVAGSPMQATSSATPEASNSGMSGGAKAGLAFGIIIALGLVAGLFFFCWRRRKNQNAGGEEVNEKSYNEKSGFAASTAGKRLSADSDKSTRSSLTPTTAPRLSLRPVTQFLPNLTSSNAQAAHEKPSTWERRPQNSAQNPFGDAAVLSEKQANPFEEGDGSASHERANSNGSSGSGEPATPKSAQFGTAAAVPVAKGPNNVHRVQLDFKPSMEDELELTSGQLVRMLHEYDDGWALCTRMDRTQQGVVPRTCLSKLAVKPRGPPQGGRPQSPNVRPPPPGANAPRPLTPTREQAAGFPKEVPARKPAPGQAL